MNTEAFLAALYGDIDPSYWWYLWTLSADGETKTTHWFSGPDVERAVTLVNASQHRHVYYPVAIAAQRGTAAQRTSANEGGIPPAALLGPVADVDIGKGGVPPTEDAALAFIESWPLRPTYCVHSGHGLQTAWLFKEPWAFPSVAEAQALTYGWAQHVDRLGEGRGYHLDSVWDVARVMRVPGSMNVKGEPLPVRVVWFDDDCRYNPEDFAPYMLDAPTMAAARAVELGTELPIEKLELLCEADPDFAATWDHTRRLPRDNSCSGYDMALASKAVQAGWSDEEIAALIRENQRRHGNKPGKDTDNKYIARTIDKARKGVTVTPLPAETTEGGAATVTPDAIADLLANVTVDNVLAAVPVLASLDESELKPVKAHIKAVLGPDIDLRSLASSISTERKTQRKARQRARLDETGKPVVTLGRQLRDVTTDATDALHQANDPPCLFVRSGQLSRVRRDENGRPIVDAVGVDELTHRLTNAANFVRVTDEGENNADPPERLARNIIAAPSWPFPPLVGVIEAPALRPDGTVIHADGYDPATGLYLVSAPNLRVPPIPEKPTPTDVVSAAGVLLNLVSDFPFSDKSSLANIIALMLTPVMRPAIASPAPLALIDAPQAGTGKSLLSEVVSIIATGREAAVITAPTTDDEWQKRITSLLLTGATVISVDNVELPLNAPSLAAALTATTWTDRRLGRNDDVLVMPQRATWLATGNNLRLRGDLPRRCYWVRLDAQSSRPWQRVAFQFPELKAHVAKVRGELLAALLTIARAWFVAGQPEPDGVLRLGSFERWCTAIGGALQTAGISGFLGNAEELYQVSDEEAEEWEAFLRVWHDSIGERPVTAASVADVAFRPESESYFGPLAEVFPAACVDANGVVNVRKLGKALSAKVDARFGPDGLHVVKVRGSERGAHSKSVRWSVRS